MRIEISGITVQINRKAIKNMHLYVKPPDGRVEVSAPYRMPEESIVLFVRTKIGWIKKQRERFENQPRQSKREYVSGETFYVWGKQYFLRLDEGPRNTLALSGDRAILTVRDGSHIKRKEAFVREWYRDLLKREIEKRLPEWETRTGLFCREWQTKYMTTRWGTCNPEKRRIWLNVQLAKKAPECLDYVLLHELAHLKVRGHGPAFVAILDQFMPRWREIRQKLNESVLDDMRKES